jgi:hypothetical protein
MKKKAGIFTALSQKTRKPSRSPRALALNSVHSSASKIDSAQRIDEEQWKRDMATLRRAAEELAQRKQSGAQAVVSARGLLPVSRIVTAIELRSGDQFDRVAASLIECSDQQRPQTLRQLYDLNPERAASFLNLVLQAGTREDRQQIGNALEVSGLVDDAIRDLTGKSHSHSYRAFSLLFLVAKAGTVGPLIRVIEDHPNIELRLALIRLLGSSGAPDLAQHFQRLIETDSIPTELCLAMREV